MSTPVLSYYLYQLLLFYLIAVFFVGLYLVNICQWYYFRPDFGQFCQFGYSERVLTGAEIVKIYIFLQEVPVIFSTIIIGFLTIIFFPWLLIGLKPTVLLNAVLDIYSGMWVPITRFYICSGLNFSVDSIISTLPQILLLLEQWLLSSMNAFYISSMHDQEYGRSSLPFLFGLTLKSLWENHNGQILSFAWLSSFDFWQISSYNMISYTVGFRKVIPHLQGMLGLVCAAGQCPDFALF